MGDMLPRSLPGATWTRDEIRKFKVEAECDSNVNQVLDCAFKSVF